MANIMRYDGDTSLAAIEKLQQKYTVLTPLMKFEEVNPFIKPAVVTVQFGEDDYWPIGGKMMHKKDAVERIAAGTGVQIVSCERTDSPRDEDRPMFTCRARVMDMGGTYRETVASYQLDLFQIEDEERERLMEDQPAKNYPNHPEWNKPARPGLRGEELETALRKAMSVKRRHRIALADSGARLRAMRALNGIKTGYTKDEAKKPVLMVAASLQPDYNDPAVKQRLLDNALGATAQAYGPQPLAIGAGQSEAVPLNIDPDTGEILEDEEEAPVQQAAPEEGFDRYDEMTHAELVEHFRTTVFDATGKDGEIWKALMRAGKTAVGIAGKVESCSEDQLRELARAIDAELAKGVAA